MIINIGDENDNKPIFVQKEYVCNVSENQAAPVDVCTVLAEDKDLGENSVVSYAFANPPDEFELDRKVRESSD